MYSVTKYNEHNLKSQKQILEFLKKNKFNINPEYKINKNINEVIENINEYEKKRYEYEYEIDGIVVKVNMTNLYDEIGYTSKFPKYMIAYKFKAKLAQTKLLEIFPTVGRTGRITYNAKLQKVQLLGTQISAATLHNANYIRMLNLNVNDIVNIKKAGDIIPKVVSIVQKNNNEVWEESTKCPSCSSDLVRLPSEVDQYCINDNCPAIIHAKLIHFTSRLAMNIDGLGPEIISLLRKHGYLKTISSIYNLNNSYNELIKLENLGTKSVTNLLKSIDKSKTNGMDKFIFALGIRHVGYKISKLISKKIKNINDLLIIDWTQFENTRDIGNVVLESLKSYFSNNENIKTIKELIKLGVNPVISTKLKSNILSNTTFVITGTLTKPREFYKNVIESHDGNVMTSVSSKTNYLLTGENPGSKLSKAQELNVKIITENQFNLLIGEASEK